MLPDIYFEKDYAKLHQTMYKGEADTFRFQTKDGIVYHSFIKRKIPQTINGDIFYDLITPYGYGGPTILHLDGDKKRLLSDFRTAFQEYCLNNKIVSEFIRFHPLLKNHIEFSEVYDTIYMRKTVATKLTGKDPYLEEFSKGAKKTIRQALKKGFHAEIIENPQQLEVFKSIYVDTMNRNKATDFYYFGDEYFDQLLKLLGKHLLSINIYLNDACVASGLYFTYEKYIHAHLSGTHKDYLKDNPAYLLKYLCVDWGKKNGYTYIHYGGGTTNDPHDPLLAFKKKFTRESLFDFYVSKNIFNKRVYNDLTNKTRTEDSTFFPAYRDPSKVCDE